MSDAPQTSNTSTDPNTSTETTESERKNQAATEAARREKQARRKLKQTKSGETIVVDFVANFVAGGSGTFEPLKGRVLMSDRRLILATSDSKTVVPLTSVFDVAVGQVPAEVEEFFDHTVMVGYVVNGIQRTTVVGGDRETIEKFSVLLYRATLRGSTVALKHPAKVGGRLQDDPVREVGLRLDTDQVSFPGTEDLTLSDEVFSIDLGNIVFFEVLERTVLEEKRLVLSVQHVTQEQTVTTEVSMGSRRKMNILGRYLRQMYHYLASDVRNLDVDDDELEVLVGMYSMAGMGDEIDLAPMLGLEEAELDVHLDSLHEDGLIESVEPPYELTPQAQFLINERFEDVNF
ncbi:chemotaxis protein CheF [Salinigranum rubrum]|uniref:Chemotaxis protein CheF n=1 Tax=Salinigranum rubrum TaxID=755307 RepID=A0A2I8VHZ8_9EURY|nr:CheF family chemotaxis protein [Salinigranum rubrum]AUV81563.1 chemotaxis protein CheF [Salinigranum rubrum]